MYFPVTFLLCLEKLLIELQIDVRLRLDKQNIRPPWPWFTLVWVEDRASAPVHGLPRFRRRDFSSESQFWVLLLGAGALPGQRPGIMEEMGVGAALPVRWGKQPQSCRPGTGNALSKLPLCKEIQFPFTYK